jgi:hypothetical protein
VDTSQSWCRRCGYYAVLGACVELAPWEKETDQSATAGGQAKAKPADSLIAVLKAAPAWLWGIAGMTVAILAASLSSKIVTSPGSLRALWGGAQFLIGLLAFLLAHLLAFVYAVSHLDSCALLDIVLRPFSIWSPIVRELPRRLWQVGAAVGGLVAMISAIAFIGVPFESLLDWNVAERAKPALARAVSDEAVKESQKSASPVAAPEETKPEETFETAECVVIGYSPSSADPNDFTALIVATITEGQLKVVGRVSDGFDDASRADLAQKLAGIRRSSPFLACRAARRLPRALRGLDKKGDAQAAEI